MRVVELMALLERYPPAAEVRAACAPFEPPSNTEDLPITGVTTAFKPASSVPLLRPDQITVWLFAGRHLEVDEKASAHSGTNFGEE